MKQIRLDCSVIWALGVDGTQDQSPAPGHRRYASWNQNSQHLEYTDPVMAQDASRFTIEVGGQSPIKLPYHSHKESRAYNSLVGRVEKLLTRLNGVDPESWEPKKSPTNIYGSAVGPLMFRNSHDI